MFYAHPAHDSLKRHIPGVQTDQLEYFYLPNGFDFGPRPLALNPIHAHMWQLAIGVVLVATPSFFYGYCYGVLGLLESTIRHDMQLSVIGVRIKCRACHAPARACILIVGDGGHSESPNLRAPVVTRCALFLFRMQSILQWSAVVSALSVFAAVGAALASPLVRCARSRRTTLLCSSLAYIAGAASCAAALYLRRSQFTLPCMLAGRALSGLGIGVASSIATRYLAEMAPNSAVRGRLGSVSKLAVFIGVLFSQAIAASVRGVPWGWLLPMALPGYAMAAWLLVSMWLLPNSPLELLARHRTEAALTTARRLYKLDEAAAQLLLQHLRDTQLVLPSKQTERVQSPAVSLWRRRHPAHWAFVLSLLLLTGQASSGAVAIVNYAGAVFRRAGVDAVASALCTSAAVAVVTAWSAARSDRVGRRQQLLRGSCAMLALIIAAAVLQHVQLSGVVDDTGVFAWCALATLVAFMCCFAWCMAGTPFVIAAELFDSVDADSALSWGNTMNWGFTAVQVLTFPVLLDAYGAAAYLPLVAALAGMVAMTRAWVPETTGRTLQEIERDLTAMAPRCCLPPVLEAHTPTEVGAAAFCSAAPAQTLAAGGAEAICLEP